MTEAGSVSDVTTGQEVAGYRVERLLGRGGMSVVYLAEDLALGRHVALKLLAPKLSRSRRFRERFRLESRVAASIDHTNVIPIYEAGEAEGVLYIAMRYVDGTDMRRMLDEEGSLPPRRAVDLVGQIADGLEAAHARGLVHRDVKPSNALVVRQGEREHVYLADFGLTKTAEGTDDPVAAARLSGTVDYIAPEQITKGVGGASADVYALGCVLYETLTGQVPYPKPSELETLWAHVSEPPPSPTRTAPQLPKAFDDVVARALAKEPAERFESPSQLAAAARAALPAATRLSRRAVLVLVVCLVALLAAALATAVVLATGGDENAAAPTVHPARSAIQRVDVDGTQLSATVDLDGYPVDLAVGGGGVVVADAASGTVYRIDAETYSTTTSRVLGGGASALSPGGAGLWLAGHGANGEGELRRLVLEADTVSAAATVDMRELAAASTRTWPPVNAVAALEAAPDAAVDFNGWVLDAAEGSLVEIRSAGSGYDATRVDTGGTPTALDGVALDFTFSPNDPLAYPAGIALWVAQEGELIELSSSSADATRIVSRTALDGTPVAVAASPTGAWVAMTDGTLARVAGGQVVARAHAEARPVDLVLGEQALWLLTSDGKLHRLDPVTGRHVDVEEVGSNPVALAVGDGAVWVAVWGGDPLPAERLPATFQTYAEASLLTPDACAAAQTAPTECFAAGRMLMRSAGGTEATAEVAWLERTSSGGGPVPCEQGVVEAPFVSTVEPAGTGRLTIERWGTLALRFDRMTVGRDAAGPGDSPVCLTGTGTWTALWGPLRGELGTFTWLGPDGDRIVLERP
jgi:serine/threonine-protein kinase